MVEYQREDLIKLRDEQQRAIIENDDTPQLVNAGPGTGKSRTFAGRLKHLKRFGANPDNTLVLSFTNACVKMLQEDLVEQGVGEFTVNTVHKIAKIIVHENIGLNALTLKKNFVVAFEHDTEVILNDAAEDLGRQLTNGTNTARSLIYSPLANLTWTVPQDDDSKKLIERYQSLRSFYNCGNFYELTQEAIKLLTNAKIKQKYLNRWKFILVDEYRDLNRADQEMIRLLTDNGKWLTLAGDDNQSIYGSMRFAYPKGMRRIQQLYPNIRIRQLEVSNRCTENIMLAAMAIAALQRDSTGSSIKKLYSLKGSGQNIVIAPLRMSNPRTGRYDESDWICHMVMEILAKRESEDIKILILGQNKRLLTKIFDRMQEKGISTSELQKPDPLDKANKDNLNLFWYLRLTLNKEDNLAFRRILGNTNATNLPKIRQMAMTQGIFWNVSDEPTVTQVKKTIEKIQEIRSRSTSVENAITGISKVVGHSDKEQLDSFLRNFKGRKGLEELIDILSLELTDEPVVEIKDKKNVQLMTFHSSKGLGGDVVFLAALEEGFLPKNNSDYSDEEVRLFYVALTRAKANLFISHVWRRYDGTSYDRGGSRKPSCFVYKIPDCCKETLKFAGVG